MTFVLQSFAFKKKGIRLKFISFLKFKVVTFIAGTHRISMHLEVLSQDCTIGVGVLSCELLQLQRWTKQLGTNAASCTAKSCIKMSKL